MDNLLQLLQSLQPTAPQSVMSALPFLNLPKKQAQAYAPAQNMLDASINPDNPIYRRLLMQRRGAGQRNLSEVIAEAQRQNRKASQMGRTPLFSAERGGEELFRNLSRGYMDIQDQADADTQNILGNAAGGYAQMGALNSQLAANKSGIKGNLLGAITKLFGL